MKIKKRKLLLKLSIFTILLFASNFAFSQCALTCTNVQVTLDENCESEILPDMISEGSDPLCLPNYIVEIYDLNGNLLPSSPFINVDHVDAAFTTVEGGQPLREDNSFKEDGLADRIMANAPKCVDNHFIVPTIIE